MNVVEVCSQDVDPPPWQEQVPRFCRRVLDQIGVDGWELSVLLTSDAAVRDLNRRYREIDSPTDILSFSQSEGEPVPGITGAHAAGRIRAAGDLVISLESAQRNALEAGVPLEQEARRLLIHGILHLAGMDHPLDGFDDSVAGLDEMTSLQEQLLRNLEEERLI